VPFKPNEIVEFTLQSPSEQDTDPLLQPDARGGEEEEEQEEGEQQHQKTNSQQHHHQQQQYQQQQINQRRHRLHSYQKHHHQQQQQQAASGEHLQGSAMPAYKGDHNAQLASTFSLLLPPLAMQEGGEGSHVGRAAQPAQPPMNSAQAVGPNTMQLPHDWAAAVACVCNSAATGVAGRGLHGEEGAEEAGAGQPAGRFAVEGLKLWGCSGHRRDL